MKTPNASKFFLGANTPSGFYSLYDTLVDHQTDKTLYIIKGSPGSGKSSFMRKIAEGMMDAGLDVEHIHCTADPDSLDAIYIPALKIAYADGTAPHVLEPAYPGVMEEYINLDEFVDTEPLKEKKAEVIALTDPYRSLYQRAYHCIEAAGKVTQEASRPVIDHTVIDAIKKRTRGIITREIGKQKNGTGKTSYRFLTALTHKGHIACFDTAEALADRVYHLDNTLGLAHYMLADLREAVEQAGLDLILCPDPMNPDQLAHLLLPSLSLAFLSSNNQIQYEGAHFRHIRLDAMVNADRLKLQKPRLRFAKKVSALLLDEAIRILTEAKATHDELERIYNPHVDWDGIYDLAEDHLQRLLS